MMRSVTILRCKASVISEKQAFEAHCSTPDAAAAVWDAAADAAAATLVSEADMAACAAACTHMLLVLRRLLRYHAAIRV